MKTAFVAPKSTDGDGTIDALDNDDDGDGVLTATELGSQENHDGNPSDAANSEGLGAADYLDFDSDNDGVGDSIDVARVNARSCRDVDADNCDDCSVTGANLSGGNVRSDGVDSDGDGACNLSDPDDDEDSVPDAMDSDPLSPRVCRDVDGDGCDDCALGLVPQPGNDGIDSDGDGLCNTGDPDDDGDSVIDGLDQSPLDATRCADVDGDTCDDYALGSGPKAGGDGVDTDGEGQCNAGDPDDDNDGVPDAADVASLVATK